MKSFLIGRKLWWILTGDITKSIKGATEESKFVERLEDWDNKNHHIITWLNNTFIMAIHTKFDAFDTTKGLWDFLAACSKTISLAHYY